MRLRTLFRTPLLALLVAVAFASQALAFSNTVQYQSVHGNDRVVYGYLTFDSSYPTGGEALSIATASNGFIFHTYKFMQVLPVGGYTFLYDSANSKVLAYAVGSSAHTHTITVTNTSTGTAVKYTNGSLKVSGNATSITTGSTTLTASALSEVANGTDLSALTAVPYMLFGV